MEVFFHNLLGGEAFSKFLKKCTPKKIGNHFRQKRSDVLAIKKIDNEAITITFPSEHSSYTRMMRTHKRNA